MSRAMLEYTGSYPGFFTVRFDVLGLIRWINERQCLSVEDFCNFLCWHEKHCRGVKYPSELLDKVCFSLALTTNFFALDVNREKHIVTRWIQTERSGNELVLKPYRSFELFLSLGYRVVGYKPVRMFKSEFIFSILSEPDL